ncbi:MAG: hypothetical protein AB4911_13770 [Oscillochloridaceae bacterium umkhey_bin13]
MLRFRTILWPLALVIMLLAGSLPVAAQVPAYRCNLYSRDPVRPYCLEVTVVDAQGQPLPGVVVTVIFGDRVLQATSRQTIDGPVTQAVATLPLEQLDLLPGDHVELIITYGSVTKREVIGFRPDPVTRTFAYGPVQLAVNNAMAPIFGRVFSIEESGPVPLNGYTLELRRDGPEGPVLDAFVAGTEFDFQLNPGELPYGTTLWLEAKQDDLIALVSFVWQREPLPMALALNWPCGGIMPHGGSGSQLPHGGSGSQLPDPFCVLGTATLNGVAQDGVMISVELVDLPVPLPADANITPVITTTRFFEQLTLVQPGPIFSAEIGRLTSLKLPGSTRLRFTAQTEQMIGSVERTFDQLGVGKAWGSRGVQIPLRQEHMSSVGLVGGQPTLVAVTGSEQNRILYAVTRDGVLLRQTPGMPGWLPLLGNTATMLGQPELTAVAALRQANGNDLLVASTLDGLLYRSFDSGQTWQRLAANLGRIQALALQALPTTGVQLYLLRDADLLQLADLEQATDLANANPLLPAPPAGSRSLTIVGQQLVIGGSAGIFGLSTTGAWQPIRNEPVQALATIDSETLLVATAQGLFRTTLSGAEWEALGLTVAVQAVAAEPTMGWAVTRDGLLAGSWSEPTWPIIARTTLPATAVQTLGAPTVYEISTVGGMSYAATQTGVMTTSDGGLNWQALNPSFTQDTRSLAVLPDGSVLALGRTGLFRVSATSIIPEPLPVAANLNPTVVRASSNGALILIGRAAGPGNQLLIKNGNGNWSSLRVGNGRGITTITFLPGIAGNSQAMIATDGDGVWFWDQTTGLTALPALPSSTSRQPRVDALLVIPGAPCTLLAGVASSAPGEAAALYTRSCTLVGDWSGPQPLQRNGQLVRSVTALAQTPLASGGRLFAATDQGFFRGTLAGGWMPIFGQPLRPQALAPAADYVSERTLLTGGQQSGIIRLFDATPDLHLALSCPPSARGATVITCTATASNQGLLAVPPGTMTLAITSSLRLQAVNGLAPALPVPQSYSVNYGALTANASQSFTFTLEVDANVRPHPVLVELAAAQVPGELFVVNNQVRQRIRLDYRDAPDLAVVGSGQRMTAPGSLGLLTFQVSNRGTQAMTTTALLELSLPAEVEVAATAPGLTLTQGRYQVVLPALDSQASMPITMTYRRASTLAPTTVVTVTAEVSSAGDDRELNNNRDRTGLLERPSSPEVIVLTHLTRLAQRGPVENVRAALDQYLLQEAALEIPLDALPACADAPQGLSCAYQQWDAAILALAVAMEAGADPVELKRLTEVALAERMLLHERIKTYVYQQISGLNPAPRYLYIIGDDEVIPYGAVLDLKNDDDRLSYPESYYAITMDQRESLYSLFRANHYPSDRLYDRLGTQQTLRLITARQPGGPAAITAALERYHATDGRLLIDGGVVAGVAKELTEDAQQVFCELMQQRGLVFPLSNGTDPCGLIDPSVRAGLPGLVLSGQLIALSDHAARDQIGDLPALALNTLTPTGEALNLVLLLGCHSGLSAGTADALTLVTELAQLGQPSIGYLGYAYAGTAGDEAVLAYAEQLQLQLLRQVLGADTITLADALRQALADYGRFTTTAHSNRHLKTLESVALFGPPTYRVTLAGLAGAAPEQALVAATLADTPHATTSTLSQAGSNLSLTLTHAAESTAQGMIYRVQPSSGTGFQLADADLPLQPALALELDPGVGGALIRGGSFTTTMGVDPVIVRGGPINQPQLYSEAAYLGGKFDRPLWLGLYQGSNNHPHLVINTGQWSPINATQRLLEALTLELTAQRVGGQPASFAGPATHCRLTSRIRVQILNGTGVARAEVVLIEDGQFKVYPMRLLGKRWSATFDAKPWSNYFVQAVGTDGSVTLDLNNGQLYIVSDEHDPCSYPCDLNTARDDLAVTFLSNGRVEITNEALTCRYEVRAASYQVFGDLLSAQQLFDSDKKLLQPGDSTILQVRLASCSTRIYAFYGSTLTSLTGEGYGGRLLGERFFERNGLCMP